MASIHKKGRYWYKAYVDRYGKRHFETTGLLHTPPGIDDRDARCKKKQNRAKAQIDANNTELLETGGARVAALRAQCARMLARARQTEAEQSGLTLRNFLDAWVKEKLPDVGQSYGAQLFLCASEFYAVLDTRADMPVVETDEEDISI